MTADAAPAAGRSIRTAPSLLARLAPGSWLFYAVLGVGTAGRLALLATPFFRLSSDHAIVYLIARHAARGELVAFFWGQSYGGTLLSLLAGGVMRVVGDHVEVVFALGVLFWAAAAWFTRAVARELFGRAAGDAAGVFAVLPGIGLLQLSVLDPGFYGPSFALAMAVVWLVVRGAPAKHPAMWALIGVLWGLLFWQGIAGAALAAPFLLWQLARQRSWRHWLAGVIGVVLGAGPWIAELLRGVPVLNPSGTPPHLGNLVTLLTQSIPASFLTAWLNQPVPTAITLTGLAASAGYRLAVAIVIGCLVLGFLVVGVARRRLASVLLVGGGALAYVAVALGTDQQLSAAHSRYAAFVMPVLEIAAGWALTRIRGGTWLALVLAACITVVPLASQLRALHREGATRWGGDVADVGAYLDAHGVRGGLADYWFSYRFTAAEDERTVLAGILPDRYPAYDGLVASRHPGAVVVNAGYGNDQLLQRTLGSGAERTVIDGWAVYLLPDGVASVRSLPWGWL